MHLFITNKSNKYHRGRVYLQTFIFQKCKSIKKILGIYINFKIVTVQYFSTQSELISLKKEKSKKIVLRFFFYVAFNCTDIIQFSFEVPGASCARSGTI